MRRAAIAIAVAAAACRAGAPSSSSAPDADLGACAACHRSEIATARARRDVHEPFRRSACASCHAPHGPDGGPTSTVAQQPELCRTCHATPASSHPGRPACTGCHAPHASDAPRLLAAPAAELCGRCHGGARGAPHGGIAVPPDACARCHVPHGVREKLLPDVVHPVAAECALCHAGSGAAGPRAAFARREPEPALCLGCHEDPRAGPALRIVHAALDAAPCTRCHDPHASRERALLAGPERDLCLGCHAAIRRKLQAADVHLPAAAGCGSCHAPHSAAEKALLRDREPVLCARCHADSAAWTRARHVHAPVRDGRCDGCHDAHGGRANLLREEGSLACGRCHAPSKGAPRGHARSDCAACHVPHASELAGLLSGPAEPRCASCHAAALAKRREGRHAPFAEGACLACHAVHAADAALVPDASSACLRCHARVRPAEGEARSVHAPFAAGACLFCHDPHGSGTRAHLRQEPALLCLSCHTALRARIVRPDAVLHAPVKAAACTECHRPHASAARALLVEEPPNLCGSCHHLGGEAMAKAHPALASSQARCTSCHDPHVLRDGREAR